MLFRWRFLGDPETDKIEPSPPFQDSSSSSSSSLFLSLLPAYVRPHEPAGYISLQRATWKNNDILNRRRLVQCERYAPKTIRRTDDWGWTLKNPNVKYSSLNQDAEESLKYEQSAHSTTDSKPASSNADTEPQDPQQPPSDMEAAILEEPYQPVEELTEDEDETGDEEMEEEDGSEISDMERDEEETRILLEHRWITRSAFDDA